MLKKSSYKNPKLSGFVWDITESSFLNSMDDNPLFTPKIHDSDSIMQEQIRLYEDEIAAFAEDPNTPMAGNGPAVHIGIDCEYQYDPETQTNLILSYQFVLYSVHGVLKGIVYPAVHLRINFNVFLGIIIQIAMRDGLIDAWPKVAFVYAHFMRADITHFEGFWK